MGCRLSRGYVSNFCIAILVCGAVLSSPAAAPSYGKKRSSSKSAVTAPTAVDQDYIAALAAANRFLHARQSHDQETGILLLTDAVKNHISEDYLSAFFSSEAETAYEIAHGKKVAPGRYSFPVTLFELSLDKDRRWTRPRNSQIVVMRTGRDDWAIDKLP